MTKIKKILLTSICTLLAIIKRVLGLTLFILFTAVFGTFGMIIVIPLFGIDKFNDFMDKTCLSVLMWCE
tara:strand:- start:298 stop:504 length:207 start_codon:yes stop_codon:yes gene_type:complete